jgi:hypothetical protein
MSVATNTTPSSVLGRDGFGVTEEFPKMLERWTSDSDHREEAPPSCMCARRQAVSVYSVVPDDIDHLYN